MKENYIDLCKVPIIYEITKLHIQSRNHVLKNHGIDLLRNDNIVKILVSEFTHHRFNPNFHTNGIDGLLDGRAVELKSATLTDSIKNVSFQFHVKGDINYQGYIFVSLKEMQIVNYYELIDKDEVEKVNNYLKQEYDNYFIRNKTVKKRDIILIPEQVLIKIKNDRKHYSMR